MSKIRKKQSAVYAAPQATNVYNVSAAVASVATSKDNTMNVSVPYAVTSKKPANTDNL